VDIELMAAFLDSLKASFVFVDTQHIIRYMNKAAISNYKQGASLLGSSLLDCHNAESCKMIVEILEAMYAGEDERLITDNQRHRIYMRAVRDKSGQLLGYYERYEPPKSVIPEGA
jgi:DUF438 domain-containing protein